MTKININKINKIRQSLTYSINGKKLKGLACLFACVLLFAGLFYGCAAIPLPDIDRIPIDRFEAYSRPDGTKIHPESVEESIPDVDILAINHEIRSVLDDKVARIKNPIKRLEAIREILLQKVRYDPMNDIYGVKTAQEVYDTGTGNCLSFSNLLVAMARYVGLNSEFQEIPTLPNWSRDGEVLFFTKHIGASFDIFLPYDHKIQLQITDDGIFVVEDIASIIYLFSPSALDPQTQETNPNSFRSISDDRAFAQFYNNIGSMHLAGRNDEDAFRYFVKSLKTDPKLSYAWSNLGILYRRNMQFDASESAYLQGLRVAGGSRDTIVFVILNNMANLYDEKGDTEKALFYKNQVAAFREKNPYYQYTVAKTEYNAALYGKSIRRFKEALRLKDDEHLFYHGLALAYSKTGNIKNAKKNINKAIRYSWNDEKKEYYELVRDKLK